MGVSLLEFVFLYLSIGSDDLVSLCRCERCELYTFHFRIRLCALWDCVMQHPGTGNNAIEASTASCIPSMRQRSKLAVTDRLSTQPVRHRMSCHAPATHPIIHVTIPGRPFPGPRHQGGDVTFFLCDMIYGRLELSIGPCMYIVHRTCETMRFIYD